MPNESSVSNLEIASHLIDGFGISLFKPNIPLGTSMIDGRRRHQQVCSEAVCLPLSVIQSSVFIPNLRQAIHYLTMT
jgi:hypothetical protein